MSQDDPRELLSSAGAARRREILAAAFCEADRRQRRRLVRRGAALTCAAAIVVASLVLLRAPSDRPGVPVITIESTTKPLPSPGKSPPVTTPTKNSRLVVEFIPADSTDRRWEMIGDDELLASLADAGQPSGLVRLNGKSMVVPIGKWDR